ncbi:hypothetical protein JCM3775_002218 [Rhodotorula graminis]|uniref:Uncharacterized protein n=1 Tax=Rhodotorula graminis (strain WP1) TaxID=578459 RepID=A0A0P9FC36_RHOGW|nr:uncharacterized protein RHOBADRAFT_65407 [Rhodotorula graminis WP1]KPV73236.1 hypothetical protein RHOBADRAFT_65407 [Rhodotorula graminis WP1]
MKFTTAAFTASAVALASLVTGQSATINTPDQLFTCEPAALTWTGGTAPYFVRVYEGGSTTALIETLQSSVSTNSYTWTVNVPAGQSVTLGLTDSTGATVYSAERAVTEGSSTSCIGQSASGSAGASTAASSAMSSATGAASSAAAAASSATSSAGGRASSATSAAGSAASSVAAGASSATSAAGAAATGNSGASTLALSGFAGVAALGVAMLA